MSFLSSHRESPEPPQSSAVAEQPATPKACEDDYKARSGLTNIHPSSFEAQPHTGRRG